MNRVALQLWFVRHGETAWSLTGQHTGHTDLALTPHGEEAARALAAALRGVPFRHVFCSTRLRAQRTCELAGLGADAQTDPDLSEWDYGLYEGRRTDEIRALRPGWDVWLDGCPGGESAAAVQQRADKLIARLCLLNGPVALFSHGQFGRALVARWIGLPLAQGQHFAIDPASVGILGYEAGHGLRRVVNLWNAPAGGLQQRMLKP